MFFSVGSTSTWICKIPYNYVPLFSEILLGNLLKKQRFKTFYLRILLFDKESIKLDFTDFTTLFYILVAT